MEKLEEVIKNLRGRFFGAELVATKEEARETAERLIRETITQTRNLIEKTKEALLELALKRIQKGETVDEEKLKEQLSVVASFIKLVKSADITLEDDYNDIKTLAEGIIKKDKTKINSVVMKMTQKGKLKGRAQALALQITGIAKI